MYSHDLDVVTLLINVPTCPEGPSIKLQLGQLCDDEEALDSHMR